jgi:limonene-1,2-epoxide hydrolase
VLVISQEPKPESDGGFLDPQPASLDPVSTDSEGPGRLRPLDIDTVRELWSKTYNADGKPDWSHIFPYYHPLVVFHDSIQRIEGFEEFRAMCQRLTKRCEKLQMDIRSVVQESNVIFMDWKMTMVFRKTPSTPIYGSTRLTLHEDGRIIEQRDYYDLWGDIFNGVPFFRKPYRSFMRRFFG